MNGAPIFDDGNLVIFGIDKLLDLYFQVPAKTSGLGVSNLACIPMMRKNDEVWFSRASYFEEAGGVLRSKGCSVMASFLEMQFLGLKDHPQFTLFAPVDEAMENHVAHLANYSSILRQHLVPCKILWGDLVGFDNGTVLRTCERGFSINVTKSDDDKLMFNGVRVIFPQLYHNDWLVVHGLQQVLSVSEGTEQEAEPEAEHSSNAQVVGAPLQSGHYNVDGLPTSHYHFSVFH